MLRRRSDVQLARAAAPRYDEAVKLHERVRATVDLPGGIEKRGVKAGATGYIVDVYRSGNFFVEFLGAGGRTIDVIDCTREQIVPAPRHSA